MNQERRKNYQIPRLISNNRIILSKWHSQKTTMTAVYTPYHLYSLFDVLMNNSFRPPNYQMPNRTMMIYALSESRWPVLRRHLTIYMYCLMTSLHRWSIHSHWIDNHLQIRLLLHFSFTVFTFRFVIPFCFALCFLSLLLLVCNHVDKWAKEKGFSVLLFKLKSFQTEIQLRNFNRMKKLD